jgi:heat shock protein HtpX
MIPNDDLRKAETLNAFYFAPAMRVTRGGNGRDGGNGGRSLSALFSTHPSLDKRIEQLEKIQRQLNDVGPGSGAKGLR